MLTTITTITGKTVRAVSRLRGGGSALPGLIAEKMDRKYMAKVLAQLPYGVVVISGTNGKTTTTKIVVELLESQGLHVFTNKTGSNFTRGVVSALLRAVTFTGKLNADIAVLELDEAHAVHFVHQVRPRYSLILNVMRDQLDRFGEVDTTAKLLTKIAQATSDTVVLNREDNHIAHIRQSLRGDTKTVYFGLSPKLRALFPDDDAMYGAIKTKNHLANSSPLVQLDTMEDHVAKFSIQDHSYSTSTQLEGVYNLFNLAGALALVRTILPESIKTAAIVKSIPTIEPAFGRGEKIVVGKSTVEFILVKNPSGFRLSLQSFDYRTSSTMIAINDHYADGRDMSWLWDVDFSCLRDSGVEIVSGIRAYDMALRLAYDEVPVRRIETNLRTALLAFIKSDPLQDKHIFTTYTAMLELRRELSKIAKVEKVDVR